MIKQIVLKDCLKIYTMAGKYVSDTNPLGMVENKTLVIESDKIKAIGDFEELKDTLDPKALVLDYSQKSILPGFVDAHTHLVFGGDRMDEYIAKLTIDDPDELKKIVPLVGMESSVKQTHDASHQDLYDDAIFKLEELVKNGLTTIEIKSGYGIDKDVEIKQLEVINKLKEDLKLTIISTYLGGHDWDRSMSKDEYIDFMIEEVIPEIARRDLADMIDIWTEDMFFSKEQGRRLLSAGIENRMEATIHTDEFSSIGASGMAAEIGAYSAAHLNYVTDEEIELMKEMGTVGIILPTTDYSIVHPDPADGRHLIDMGLDLAISTNINPGNYSLSPSLVINMACRNHGLTPEEAFIGFTINGAKALRLDDSYGSLEEGKYADIQVWNTDDITKVSYYHGADFVESVYKHGELIMDDKKLLNWRKI